MRIRNADTNVRESILQAHIQTLKGYRATLREASNDTTYASPATALAAPSDTHHIDEALAIATEFGPSVQTVLLVGIGGSDLGTRAVYDALKGHAERRVTMDGKKLVCFDTLEPLALSRCAELFETHTSPEEVVLVIISKSGGTVETIANANVLFAAFEKRFGREAATRRTLYIGDDNDRFHGIAGQGVRCVAMPSAVGGRYSVFTVVGLVPLALLGIDIRAFCEGAQRAVRASSEEGGPAEALAALLFESYTTGCSVHELVMFHPELETMGKWYRQLLAESLGKERGDTTHIGIMPSVFVGSTDLHSMGQLVFGGPRNRFTTFVAAPSVWTDAQELHVDSPFMLPMLEQKHPGNIIRAIYEGVQTAYRKNKLPFCTTELEAITPREIGAWMALHMAAVMYTAELLGVNAFDQPAVEEYKDETRRILTGV